MVSPFELVRVSVLENIKMQDKYLPIINNYYLEAEEFNLEEFKEYLNNLYELAIMTHDMIPISAITSLGMLCSKEKTCPIVLPYYL